MERRKLYNRAPCRLPHSTRWRHAESERSTSVGTSYVLPGIEGDRDEDFVEELLSTRDAPPGIESDDYMSGDSTISPGKMICTNVR